MSLDVSSSMRTWSLVTFVVYTIICIVLGNISFSRSKKKSDFGKEYYAGGGNMGFLAVGFLIAGGCVSGGTFLSTPGLSYSWGLIWAVISGAAAFSSIIPAILINKKLKIVCSRIGAVSYASVMHHRYGNNKLIAWYSSLAIVVFQGLFLYMQVTSGARLMEAMVGVPYIWGLVIFGIVVLAYTIVGGSKGASIVSIFQGVIMTITTIALFIGVVLFVSGKFGTVAAAFQNVSLTNPEIVEPCATFGLSTIASYIFQITMCSNIGPNNVGAAIKIGTSKSLHRSTVITLIFMGLWSIIMPILGTMGRTVFSDVIPDTITPVLALTTLPPILAGIVASGVVASIQSTVSMQMLNVNSCIVMDMYKNLIKKGNATDAQLKRANKISVVVILAITVALAIKPPQLIGLISIFSVAGGACVFFVPLIFGLWWKRANKVGCIASMIAGMAYFILANSFSALCFGMLPVIPSLTIAVIAMIIGSLLTRPPEADVLDVWFGVGRSVL